METFTSPDKQYIINMYMKQKDYNFSEYDKYNVFMDINDVSGINKVSITTNELEFVRFLNELSIFIDEFYGMINSSHFVPFDFTFHPNIYNQKINISCNFNFPNNLIGSSDIESPEDDYMEEYLCMSVNRVFNDRYMENVIHMTMDTSYIEELIMCGWNTIQDVPDVESLIYSELLESLNC